MSTNENTPISGEFWDWMQSYWHSNRDFPPAHPDWRKKADLVNGKVPAGQLPSYVDDVLEFDSYTSLPQTGEKGKIYITTKDNKQFRWGGSAYVEINSDENVMTLSTGQGVFGRKTFYNQGQNFDNLSLVLWGNNGSRGGIGFVKGGKDSAILNFDTEFHFTNNTNNAYKFINAAGVKVAGSDDSHLLLGGGGHKPLSELMTTNTAQNVIARKEFITSGGDDSINNTIFISCYDGHLPAISFYRPGIDLGQLKYVDSNLGFYFVNSPNSDTVPANAKGFRKSGSDDNYVLLGGGGHKPVSEFVSSADFSTVHKFDQSGGINNGSGTRTNKSWFDYHWAETGKAGSVINFSGLSGAYSTELFADYYYGNSIGLRTHNGDTNSWNPVRWLWHSGNFDPKNFIPKKANQIYYGHKNPNENIGSTEIGVVSYNNNDNYSFGDYIHFGGGENNGSGYRNLVMFYKHGGGMRQYFAAPEQTTPYTDYVDYWHTGNLANPLQADDHPFASDFNDLRGKKIRLEQGWNAMNQPAGTVAGHISTFNYDINLGAQQFHSYYTNDLYLRIRNDNTYSSWQKVWHTGNFNPDNKADVSLLGSYFPIRQIQSGTDANNEVTSGLRSDYIWTNTPASTIGTLLVETYTADWIAQTFTILGAGEAGACWKRIRHSGTTWTNWVSVFNSGNLNPVTLDTPQTIIHQKTFSQGIGLTSGQKINLAGYGDPAHYIKRFDDDTDGFGISTAFAVKPYNNYNTHLFKVGINGDINLASGGKLDGYGNLTLQQQSSGNNATGISWQKIDDTEIIAGIGSFTGNGEFEHFYLGWGNEPWIGDKSLMIGKDAMYYKNNVVYHAGNFNPDGYQVWVLNQLNNYFNKFAIDYTGSNHDLNTLSQTGFYSIAYGTANSGNYTGSRDGQRALLHLETENVYSASQIQTERYNGNIVSRTRADGGWSNWVRHWGDNDFTASDVSKWNNAISQSSASEEVILEDDTLKIQPDEFSLEGSGSYDIASRKKLVHVLVKEGKELVIRELVRRQTFVVFNFSKNPVDLNIEGLKSYALSPGMQVTLYISDKGEVLLYNETAFKKLQ